MLQAHHHQRDLSLNQVHLWLADLRDWLPNRDNFLDILSQDEIQRQERYKIAAKQDQFITSRGLLRQLLAGYLEGNPADIQLTTNQAGKPSLPDGSLQFNLSHSGDWLLYGIVRSGQIGVDIQEIYPISHLDTLKRNYFSNLENAYLDSLSPSKRLQEFFRVWTAKEAYLKGCGEGFTASPRSVDLLPRSDGSLSFTLGGTPPADKDIPWTIQGLDLPDNYLGAVAVQGSVQEILQIPLTPVGFD